jgi:hypothetical protein
MAKVKIKVSEGRAAIGYGKIWREGSIVEVDEQTIIKDPGLGTPVSAGSAEDKVDDGLAYEKMNAPELRELLKAKGLTTSGNKDRLISRLKEYDEFEGSESPLEEPEGE